MAAEKPRPSERLLRFLVRLLPFELRFDHGREIEQTFRAQERAAARAGRSSLWRVWAEFIGGIFQTAPREHLSILRQDAAYALRRMRQSPGFTAVVLLTLALGIGANTAIFSIVNGVLLRPLPYAHGKELLRLRQSFPKLNITDAGFSEKEILDFREQNHTLDAVVEYHSMVFILIGKEPYRVQTGVVSPEFFDIFGVKPLHGRTFRAEDDVPGTAGVLILSYPFWQRTFGGDPGVVGRVLQMNNRPHTVVGILPPIPQYPDENDVYMPVSHCPFRSSEQTRTNRNARMSTVFARQRPGAPLAQVQADLGTISQRLGQSYADAYPKNSGYTATARNLKEELVSNARPTFLVLLATAGFVLLIACANVANLTLSRAVHRERELSIRAALGANRGRLLRQLLTESALLSVAGGALGLLMAWFGSDLPVRFAQRYSPRAIEIQLDANVLLFVLAASVLTGLVFGMLPALSAGQDPVRGLKEGSPQTAGGTHRSRARGLLVVTQVAFSVVLLTGAGLMLRSFVKMLQVDPGYRGENVVAARVSTSFSKYSDPDIRKVQQRFRALYDGIFRQLAGQPEIVSMAAASGYPMMPDQSPFNRRIQIEGRPDVDGQPAPRAEFHTVSPDYFRVIGVPLLRGRTFESRDNLESPRVVVISQAMANHFWPNQDPIGKRVGAGNPVVWSEVVGIVGDVKEYGPSAESPIELYLPFAQDGFVSSLLVRTSAEPARIAEVLRRAVQSVDPDAPVGFVRTLEDARHEWVAGPRVTTMLLGIFGALALAITATGITGVLALSVSQRRHEIGIRMALGATPGEILGMVLRQGMLLVVIGMGAGIAGAALLTNLMRELLFGVEPTDPLTFAAVSGLLMAVAAAACLLPARRAATIDPITALHSE